MTVVTEVAGWRERAATMADQLATAGVLTDPDWRAAIEQTPRHVFVPLFYRDADTIVDGSNPATIKEWLDAVYSDDSLVTQRVAVPGADLTWPTSSSTMPSLMVRMLELLEVNDDSRVLEIGTATGYNAALLCHRLGDGHVASIELHPTLATEAAEHLAALGYRPTLAVGDGGVGIPRRAPYERVIATCAVPAVPAAWIDQLAPGGRIVTDLRSEMSSSLAVLDKTSSDTVVGRLLEQPGHFMWLRPDAGNPLLGAGSFNLEVNLDEAETVTTDLDPRVLDEPGLRVVLGLLEPDLWPPSRIQRGEARFVTLRTADGRWADATLGTPSVVTQGGPCRIWPAVEHAVAEWLRLGRPGRGRYGLTAVVDGTHRYWVDTPDNPVLTSVRQP